MAGSTRLSTGVPGLDDKLGGGLIPGTLTVIVGATGIGKTQLGLQFAHAGRAQEQRSGIIFDMSARGDSQNHANYADRMFQWQLDRIDSQNHASLGAFFDSNHNHGDYVHVFDYRGQRVTQNDLSFEQWQEWQGELNAKLRTTVAFLYGNFLQGCRRVVIDGVEPSDRPAESIQLNLFEYIYHQVLRKEPEWVARDLFREHYRENAEQVARHVYPHDEIGCVLLCTSHETMLDDLISRGLDEGDAISNANTLIYLGKTTQNRRMGRSLYIAKHRGSSCSDEMIEYAIDDQGLRLTETS